MKILDACCGSKMFWFNKNHPDTIYMDNRELVTELCDGRTLKISPDVIGDFRDIQYPDNSFYLVVFDPPHLLRAGEKSWLAKKYGKLGQDWQSDLQQGFRECLRVLKPNGILIFKWNEDQVKLKDVLACADLQPLFGDRRRKTHWLTFMKPVTLPINLCEMSQEVDDDYEYHPIKGDDDAPKGEILEGYNGG